MTGFSPCYLIVLLTQMIGNSPSKGRAFHYYEDQAKIQRNSGLLFIS